MANRKLTTHTVHHATQEGKFKIKLDDVSGEFSARVGPLKLVALQLGEIKRLITDAWMTSVEGGWRPMRTIVLSSFAEVQISGKPITVPVHVRYGQPPQSREAYLLSNGRDTTGQARAHTSDDVLFASSPAIEHAIAEFKDSKRILQEQQTALGKIREAKNARVRQLEKAFKGNPDADIRAADIDWCLYGEGAPPWTLRVPDVELETE